MLHPVMAFLCPIVGSSGAGTFTRINQPGYVPADTRITIAFSMRPVPGNLIVSGQDGKAVFSEAERTDPVLPLWHLVG